MAIWFTKIYNCIVIVPKWMLLLVSGSIASVLIGLLHGKSSTTQVPAPVPAVTKPTAPIAPTAASGTKAPSSPSPSRKPKAPAGTTARSSVPPATANTDSEHESSAPSKRTSARQRKAKK